MFRFESDDAESKSGFENACEFINTKMTEFFKGKELPLTKKVFDQLANWVERQRNRLQSQQSVEAAEGEDDDEEAQANRMRLLMKNKCNSYAIRSCLEALWFAYGYAMTPELPIKSLY